MTAAKHDARHQIAETAALAVDVLPADVGVPVGMDDAFDAVAVADGVPRHSVGAAHAYQRPDVIGDWRLSPVSDKPSDVRDNTDEHFLKCVQPGPTVAGPECARTTSAAVGDLEVLMRPAVELADVGRADQVAQPGPLDVVVESGVPTDAEDDLDAVSHAASLALDESLDSIFCQMDTVEVVDVAYVADVDGASAVDDGLVDLHGLLAVLVPDVDVGVPTPSRNGNPSQLHAPGQPAEELVQTGTDGPALCAAAEFADQARAVDSLDVELVQAGEGAVGDEDLPAIPHPGTAQAPVCEDVVGVALPARVGFELDLTVVVFCADVDRDLVAQAVAGLAQVFPRQLDEASLVLTQDAPRDPEENVVHADRIGKQRGDLAVVEDPIRKSAVDDVGSYVDKSVVQVSPLDNAHGIAPSSSLVFPGLYDVEEPVGFGAPEQSQLVVADTVVVADAYVRFDAEPAAGHPRADRVDAVEEPAHPAGHLLVGHDASAAPDYAACTGRPRCRRGVQAKLCLTSLGNER